MEQVLAILGNRILIAGILAWFVAQMLKVILTLIVQKRFDSSRLMGSGGMPSSHSATMCAIATAVGYSEGFDSALFAISICFAFVVMYDAAGVRRAAGKQAEVLNRIIDEILHSDGQRFTEKRLKELIGHTPLQVIAGALLGVLIGTLVG